MCQYRKNYSEEAEEYRLAIKTKAKASAKASFRLSNNHDYDEGSNEDEQANSDQDGEVDTSKDDSADHKIFDDEGIKNKISRKSAKISNSEGNPRQSTASISGSSPQSRKRLLSTSSKRSSKKVTPQRNFSLTSTSKKINKKSDTPLRSQVISLLSNFLLLLHYLRSLYFFLLTIRNVNFCSQKCHTSIQKHTLQEQVKIDYVNVACRSTVEASNDLILHVVDKQKSSQL